MIKTLTQSNFYSKTFSNFIHNERGISDITKACSNLSCENTIDNLLNKKRNNNNELNINKDKNQKIDNNINNNMWNEAMKNKQNIEKEKIHVNDDMIAKLLQYKKKK